MEPNIVVNGNKCSTAQSVTLRVALNHFSLFLQEEGLGDDEIGKRITAGYLEAINEVQEYIKDK